MSDESSFIDRLIGKAPGPYGDDQLRVDTFLARVRGLDLSLLMHLAEAYRIATIGGDPNRIRYAISLAMDAGHEAGQVKSMERIHEEIRRLIWATWWIADYSNADFEMIARDAAVAAVADAAWALLLKDRLLPSVYGILIATWTAEVGPLEPPPPPLPEPRLSFDDIDDPEDLLPAALPPEASPEVPRSESSLPGAI